MHAKPYHPVVLGLIAHDSAKRILDAPCGQGWLGHALVAAQASSTSPFTASPFVLDGAGLYEFPAANSGYRHMREHDLNQPLPPMPEAYDTVVSGEAIHLLASPGVMIESFRAALKPGGRVIITTPNSWAPNSRLRFLRRGFHSGFASSIDKTIGNGKDYVTYFPFSFDQLHVLLRHYGFQDITLHPVVESKAVTIFHKMLAYGSRRYCRNQAKRASSEAVRRYWHDAGSNAAQHGRWLVVSARSPDPERLARLKPA